MQLTASNVIEFVDVPSEVDSKIHFTFDYPATHTVTSFEIKDLTGKFVKYDATYNSESESVTKVIGGENISYKRFITTGKLQGEGTYKITLSKGLDE
jgi:predicted nucleotidyltransferase